MVVVVAAAMSSDRATALDRDRRLTQFHHTAWSAAAGAPPDIWALAQSPDGFLWLGTGSGLFRFDGIRFERIQPAAGNAFLSNDIISLLSLPSGELWLGYQSGGVSQLSGGRLTNFTKGLPPGAIAQLNVDRSGAIWAVALDGGAGSSIGKFSNGSWARIGPSWGVPDFAVRGLVIDPNGTVWLSGPRTLLRLRAGEQRFEPTTVAANSRTKLFLDPGNRLWASEDLHGTRVLTGDGKRSALPHVPHAAASNAVRVIFDRVSALWASGSEGGLFRVGPAAVAAADGPLRKEDLIDRFGLADGLSSEIAVPLLEDREGSIWVGTNLGLDRFRAADVVAQTDVPVTSPYGYRAAFDGDGIFYVADSTSLRRIGADGVAHIVASGLARPRALCRSGDGSLLLANEGSLHRISSRGFEQINVPRVAPSSSIMSCQEDKLGRLWLSVLGKGLFRQDANGWSHVTVPGEPPNLSPNLIVSDRNGRMWLNYPGPSLVMIEGTRLVRYGALEGLDVGNISIVYPRANGILVGGDQGIARLDGRRFQSLKAFPGISLMRVSGIAETDRGETWFNGITGIIRVMTRDLDAAFNRTEASLAWRLFDFQDGLPGLAQQDSATPTAIAAPDGRVWFITNHGLAWIDPTAYHQNTLVPPVVIRSLRANGRDIPISAAITIAAGSSNLQINYTALSLAIPERVSFRYKLDGSDTAWIDPGTRREAFYTNLGPGHYVFQVIAANNDGVWNRQGARLSFDIAPTFWQSNWFVALCVASGALLLWLAYRIRVGQLTGQLRERLGQRLAERERIARDLHDTLLQGFQGLILKFQSVANAIPEDLRAHAMIGEALASADKVLSDGRDSVMLLRTADSADVAEALSETANRMRGLYPADFSMVVEGRPRTLHPIVRSEVCRIGEEAIINAFQHGEAKLIEVALSYGATELTLGIRDNGVGIDPQILDRGGRQGHFGLIGMQERATQIEGVLTVSSRADAGTDIRLVVPGRLAYVSHNRRKYWPWGGFAPLTTGGQR